MTRAKDISKIVTDANLSGTLDVTGTVTAGGLTVDGTGNVVADFNTTNSNADITLDNTSYGVRLRTNNAGGFSVMPADTTYFNVAHNGDISFYEDTGTTPKLFWKSAEEQLSVQGAFRTLATGVGSTPSPHADAALVYHDNTTEANPTGIFFHNTFSSNSSSFMSFRTRNNASAQERVRISADGNLLVDTTSASIIGNGGFAVKPQGSGTRLDISNSGGTAMLIDLRDTDGDIVGFYKDGSAVGSISFFTGGCAFVGNSSNPTGIQTNGNNIIPTTLTALSDNAKDLGHPSYRWDDIYATNGTIQTSDQQEKNTITDSDLGIDFIKRLTPKSYIFNGKTRTHYGLIAQDVETVLGDISKPASGFAGFIKTDISEEQDGSEYRYGLRYTEFIAPLIQAVKDQQATIDALTARITALENGV